MNKLTMEPNELRQMLTVAAEMGAHNALKSAGLIKTEISKAEAYRRFSRKSVDKWIRTGKVVPVKRGNSIKLRLLELEALSKTNMLVQKQILRQVS